VFLAHGLFDKFRITSVEGSSATIQQKQHGVTEKATTAALKAPEFNTQN